MRKVRIGVWASFAMAPVRTLLWLTVALFGLAPAVSSQSLPVMVRDIAPGSVTSGIFEIVDVNGIAFMASNNHLYRSDGTAAGTVELCRFCNPKQVTNLSGVAIFEGAGGLFRSDGTVAGTGLLADLGFNAWPADFTRVGDVLYFISRNENFSPVLWKTDGTAIGTVVVKSFSLAEGRPRLNSLTAAGDILYFETASTNGVVHLWTIPQGATEPGVVRSFSDAVVYGLGRFRNMVAIGSTLYFSQYSAGSGVELWRSNGTADGTHLVRNIAPGAWSSKPMYLTNFNGQLAFVVSTTGSDDFQLWLSDGTTEGTRPAHPDLWLPAQLPFGIVGNRLIVTAFVPGAQPLGLFSSDGTVAGTERISDQEMVPFALETPLTLDGILYFTSLSAAHGSELWRTTGTAPGTSLVADIFPGVGGSMPHRFSEVGGALFFIADDGLHGNEPWRIGLPTRLNTPLTRADAFETRPNTPISVPAPGILANDSDNGGGAMSAVLVSAPVGTVALNLNGSFTFTPPPGFTGTATFSYRATNATGAGNIATVSILVTQMPTTNNDSYSTPRGQTLTVAAPGVLANDSNPVGGALSAQLVTTTGQGALSLNANGGFVYAPPPSFVGTTTFTYRAVNSSGAGNVATVTISVVAVPPVTMPDAYSGTAGGTISIGAPGVLANDQPNGGGALTAALVSSVTRGTLSFSPSGAFTYTPQAGFVGQDSFTYRATNSGGASNVSTVTLTVSAATTPQPPSHVRVRRVVGNTVTLQITPPTHGPQPRQYVIEGGVGPGQVQASLPTGTANPVFTFTAPTGAFFARVHSITDNGRSGPSAEFPLFVNVRRPPSAPESPLALANGNTIALAWKNTFEGGAPTAVMLDVTGTLNATLSLGLTEAFQFAGVPNGTYTLRLRAVNATGSSAQSTPVTMTFPSVCSGAPQPPTNVAVSRQGRVLSVVWDPAASGVAPTAFVLNVTGSYNGSLPTGGRSLSGAVGPGTYNLSVVATNACGASAPSAVQTVVVP